METPGNIAVVVDSWSPRALFLASQKPCVRWLGTQCIAGLPYWEDNSFIVGCSQTLARLVSLPSTGLCGPSLLLGRDRRGSCRESMVGAIITVLSGQTR